MFNKDECDHVPMNGQTEADRTIAELRDENELLKGCIMEICDVVFAE